MVTTISPLVKGSRVRWLASLFLFTLSAMLGAAILGALLAVAGRTLLGPGLSNPQLWTLLMAAVLAGMHDARIVRLPLPLLHRSVPQSWWVEWGWARASIAYGAVLGLGVTTVIPYASFYIVPLAAFALAQPDFGWWLGTAYGLSRALPVAFASIAFARDLPVERMLPELFIRRALLARALAALSISFAAAVGLSV